MTTDKEEFEDIPGTYLFNAERSKAGYHLNMFCMSLLKPENREAFRADEAAYLDRFPMTPEQRRTVLERDWLGMIKAGGNIYYTAKLGATDGKSFQYIAGKMSGITAEEYADMMLKGGRSIEHNRSKSEAALKAK
jgi:protocatechuate 4,5-dioxygenase alpha chain